MSEGDRARWVLESTSCLPSIFSKRSFAASIAISSTGWLILVTGGHDDSVHLARHQVAYALILDDHTGDVGEERVGDRRHDKPDCAGLVCAQTLRKNLSIMIEICAKNETKR